MCSAIAAAASLADTSINAYKLSSTVSFAPTLIPAVLLPASIPLTAALEYVMISLMLQFSTASKAVMTFVMLAGYLFVLASFP